MDAISSLNWKPEWPRTRRRFEAWWRHRGLLVGGWEPVCPPLPAPRVSGLLRPPPPATPEAKFLDFPGRVARERCDLAFAQYPFEHIPLTNSFFGPAALAGLFGSTPVFDWDTAWYHPRPDAETPEAWEEFRFDPAHPWWRQLESYLRQSVAAAQGAYLTGIPELVEHLDILATLRGPEAFLMDLYDRPDWVKARLHELNRAWRAAYDAAYEIVRQPDGACGYGIFRLWGAGRTAKVQVDCSGMLSPEQFAEFAVPALREQCAGLDFALFHLDGTQNLRHLDQILAIPGIAAVEWTPQAGVEPGWHPRWFDLYRRIKAAGRSVQVPDAKPEHISALLDAVGPEGMYLLTYFESAAAVEEYAARLAPYYRQCGVE